jgi:hypothetical protein
MILLKKYWYVVVALAVLIFFLWKGCKPGPDHSGDKKAMDSLSRVYTVEKIKLIARADSLGREDSAKQAEIDRLIAEQLNLKRDLSGKGKAIDQTIASGVRLRIIHDTPGIVSNCDTLTKQVIEGKAEVIVYQGKTDSLIAAQQEQARVKDSLIATWHTAFLHADTAVDFQKKKYDDIYKDYVKVNRKLKFSNVMGKVGGTVIGILAVALIVKK